METGPFDLDEIRVTLGRDGDAATKAVGPNFYEELVYLLSGRAEFVRQTPGAAPESLQLERPGQFALVPRGAWPTARPRGRTALLFMTPGQGTQNAESPPV